jgi:poly(hydroxyalkanoate) granule-associated protein
MAVKKKTEKQTTSWIGEVEKYSRQIWLAGLGAYSKVSKDGNKLFDTLVKYGEKAEKLAKTEVDKQVGAVKSTVGSKVDTAKSRVDEVKDKALGKWGELEEAFDKRLNNAISRLGVPSRNEVKALNAKVESLTKQIEQLTGVSVKSVKPAAKKVAAKPVAKAAAKPAAKAAAKPAAKPAAKAAAKPAVKAAAKPAAKPAVKAAAKPAAKPAVKAAAKPVAAKPAAPAPAVAAAPAPAAAPVSAPAAAAPVTPASQS